MAKKKGSKKKEVKKEEPKEDNGATFVYEDEAEYKPLYVPDDVKLERVKKTVKQDRIKKDKEVLDFWLRHTLGLGTKQIRALWKTLDKVYRR